MIQKEISQLLIMHCYSLAIAMQDSGRPLLRTII